MKQYPTILVEESWAQFGKGKRRTIRQVSVLLLDQEFIDAYYGRRS